MIKIKQVFLVALFSIVLYACGDDNNNNTTVIAFDHAAQSIIDNDSLVSFFKKHYYDTASGEVKPLVAGETALSDDINLKNQAVTEGEVDYTLYYYVEREGNPTPVKGNPTVMDSVLAKYNGKSIINTDGISSSFDSNTTWFTLSSVIRGWTYGFPNFKGGENVSTNNPGDPIEYIDGGKGVLFIPSGLGYRNSGNTTGTIAGNTNLIFYIELFDIVEDTDTDEDGIPSIDEDIDNDGDPRNDDTDGDRIPNFGDADDDGDGKLTKDEDRNGDGDPRNDFNDPDNPTLPDYLNPNIFG